MCLFYLVEQQHAVGCLAYGIGKQSAILVAHISGRRAYELGYGMLLGIFAHIKPNELNAQLGSQLACYLGFAYTSRSYKQQTCHRFKLVA